MGYTQYYGNFSSDGAGTGVGAGSSDTTANVPVPVSGVWRGKKTDTDTGTGSGITSPLIVILGLNEGGFFFFPASVRLHLTNFINIA